MNVCTLLNRKGPKAPAGARGVLSLKEIATLADIPEKRVRKDIETGVLSFPYVTRLNDSRLCFHWAAVVTFAAVYSNDRMPGGMRRVALDRMHAWVDRSRACLETWVTAKASDCSQEHIGPLLVEIDRYVTINLSAVCAHLRPRIWTYMHGLAEVEENPDILGGEAVFKDTRLSVMHVGKMVHNGEKIENILEDYPYLSAEDVEFAHLYWRAHPSMGRPRTSRESGADAEACTG